MLAKVREGQCSRKQLQQLLCEQKQQNALQLTVETRHLLYNDAVLTVRHALLQRSVELSIQVLHRLITDYHSRIFFTFNTLFHRSLESPKRPLALHTDSSTPGPLVSNRSRNEPARCGRKVMHNKSKTLSRAKSCTHKGNFKTVTPTEQGLRFSFESNYYPGWKSRRHSITAHNAPSQLPISASTTNKRLSRHYSIGLVSPDKFGGPTFPATIMYAKIISHMEDNLVSGRHFYRLQRFNNCFCGHSMVNCLLAYCIKSLNSCITKEKAIEMCRRMLSRGVIENVSHKKQQEAEGMVFKGSRLYRFTGHHFWDINAVTELDGAKTSSSMPSLDISPERKRSKRPSIKKKMYATFTESKTGFVRKCKSRFSQREVNTI